MGSIIPLIAPTIDSTINCPLEGINETLPTNVRMERIISREIIQLVIIEFVTGKLPIEKAVSAVRLTPSPAPKSWVDESKRKTKGADLAISSTHKYFNCSGQ